jgi:ribosomal protein S18 acetylase RimI-like enzyme
MTESTDQTEDHPEKQPPKRVVEVIPITQPPVQYVVFEDGGKKPAGYCLITISIKKSGIIDIKEVKTAALWHIHIDPEFRGKGYGTSLIKALKHTFQHIYSQGLTPEGRKLLLNNGFVRDKEEEKNDGNFKMYHWRK